MSKRADEISDRIVVRYKVVYKDNTKRVSDLQSFAQLYAYVQKEFPQLGTGFKILYEDSDKDLITMSHQEDYELAVEECGALMKVIIKEDLEQSTIVMQSSMAQDNKMEDPDQYVQKVQEEVKQQAQPEPEVIQPTTIVSNNDTTVTVEEMKIDIPVIAPDATQNQNIIIEKVSTTEIEGIEPEKSVHENVIAQNLEGQVFEAQSQATIQAEQKPYDEGDMAQFNQNLQKVNNGEQVKDRALTQAQADAQNQPVMYNYDQIDMQSHNTDIQRVNPVSEMDMQSQNTEIKPMTQNESELESKQEEQPKQEVEEIVFDIPEPRMTDADQADMLRKKEEQEQLMELGKLSNELMLQNDELKNQVQDQTEQIEQLRQENENLKKELMNKAHNDLKVQRLKSSTEIKLCWKCDGMGVSSNKKGLPCKKCRGTGKIQSEMVKQLDEYLEQEIEKFAPVAFKKMLIMYNNMGKGYENKAEHVGIKCSVCQTSQIRGTRYACNIRPDFNICEECEQAEGHTHKYAMTIIRYPYLSNGYNPPSAPEQIVPSADDLIKKAAEQARDAQIKGMGKRFSAKFEKENFADKTVVEQGKPFQKTWTFKNDGSEAWPFDTTLARISGAELSQQQIVKVGLVKPDNSVDVTVECTAPADAGNHVSFFRLQINGEQIGPKVWIDVIVKKSEDQSMGLKSLMEPNAQMMNQSVSYNAVNNYSMAMPQPEQPKEVSAFADPKMIQQPVQQPPLNSYQAPQQPQQPPQQQQQQFQGWNANFVPPQQQPPQQNQFNNNAFQQPPSQQPQPNPQQQQPMWQSQQWNAPPPNQQQQQPTAQQQQQFQQQQQQQPVWQSQAQPSTQPPQQQQQPPSNNNQQQNQFQPINEPRQPRQSLGLSSDDLKKITYSEKLEGCNAQFKSTMQQLMEIGFLEYDKNLQLCQKYNGDITKILGELC